MQEEARITFYRIERCGYYKGRRPTPEFGNIDDILTQFMAWAKTKGRSLAETCTYEPEESSNLLKTYCHNIVKHSTNGDYLLTTWNQTPTNQGRVAAVEGNKPVGAADVTFNDVPKGAIPGYATYFWFIPSRKVFATVRFQHVLNGHDGMVKLLGEYMAKFTRYVVREENPEAGVDLQILGYSGTPGAAPTHLVPRLRTSLFNKQASIDLILASYPVIRKILRKNLLIAADPEDLDLWQKLLKKIGMSSARNQDEMAIKYEVPYHPTKAELKGIVDDWLETHDSKWDDIGFQYTNDSEVHWLSHSIAKSKFNLDVTRDNDEVVNTNSLLAELTKVRELAISLTE